MGKGKGDKSGFYSFIDESFFAFWFRQWATFFFVIGIILIIVGIVVFAVVPPQQYKTFAEGQIVTSASDQNYPTWVKKNEQVRYDFLNTNPTTLKTSVKGPYIYDLTTTKTSVVFNSDGTVQYVSHGVKLFHVTDSASITDEITLVNPTYVDAAQQAGSELALLYSVSGTYVNDLKNYLQTQAPYLIGAKILGKNVQDSFDHIVVNTIIPSVFDSTNGLALAIANYRLAYGSHGMNNLPCAYCTVKGTVAGLYSYLFRAWQQNSECRAPGANNVTDTDFKAAVPGGFSASPNKDCGNMLKALGIAGWFTGDVFVNLIFNLDFTSTTRDIFYDPVDPTNVGYCVSANRAGAIASLAALTTPINVNASQLDFICDTFFPHVFQALVTNYTTTNDMGHLRFCGGNSAISNSALDLTLVSGKLASTPPGGLGVLSSLHLSMNSMTTYDNAVCTNFVNAFSDVNNFIIPLYQGTTPSATHGLTTSQVQTAANYLNGLSAAWQQWFASELLSTGTFASVCPTSTCAWPAYNGAGFGQVSADVAKLATVFFDANYGFANPSPQVVPNPEENFFFSDVSDAISTTGLISWYFNFTVGPNFVHFNLNNTQKNALQDFVTNVAIPDLFSKIDTGYSASNFGMTQFLSGHLACGDYPTSSSSNCYLEETFYGITKDFYVEFASACDVSSDTPVFFESFTSADASICATRITSDMTNMLTAIAINSVSTGYETQYLNFLYSAYLRNDIITPQSGVFATHIASEWIQGFNNTALAAVYPASWYAIDPDAASIAVRVYTGSGSIDQAYQFYAFNGTQKLQFYPTQDDDVLGLFNFDGLPPNTVTGGSAVSFLDTFLAKTSSVTFASSQTTVNTIPCTKGTASNDDWKAGKLGITTNYLLPNPQYPSRFLSPCTVSLNSALLTTFPAPTGTDSFPAETAVYADLGTGVVVDYTNCLVYSVGTEGLTFPYSGLGLGSTAPTKTIGQVMRRSNRLIDSTAADTYLQQSRHIQDTALAVLLALVIVGGLFVIAGAIFISFWLIRRKRKMSERADMDLVEDPFGEKKKTVATLKY